MRTNQHIRASTRSPLIMSVSRSFCPQYSFYCNIEDVYTPAKKKDELKRTFCLTNTAAVLRVCDRHVPTAEQTNEIKYARTCSNVVCMGRPPAIAYVALFRQCWNMRSKVMLRLFGWGVTGIITNQFLWWIPPSNFDEFTIWLWKRMTTAATGHLCSNYFFQSIRKICFFLSKNDTFGRPNYDTTRAQNSIMDARVRHAVDLACVGAACVRRGCRLSLLLPRNEYIYSNIVP